MIPLSTKQRLLHRVKGTKVFDAAMAIYDDLWLLRRRDSCADHGEDRFVLDYYGGKTTGVYIDVGANHPFRISNTYLLYRHGWSGLTIEPITRLFEQHRRKRPRDIQLNCGVSSASGSMKLFELTPGVMSTFDERVAHERIQSGQALLVGERKIDVVTLQEVVQKYLAGQPVDLLTMDTEGHDREVLAGIDWNSFRPTLVLCETIGDEQSAIDACMKSHGYRVLARLGYNTFYETRA